MAMPTITVEIAFANTPFTPTASLTWTDVSAYVRAFRTRRGREDELGRIEAGTAEIVLDNRDRRFDPTYTSGPYYPNVVPAKRVRIRAFYSPFIYEVFYGFVEAWPPDWPRSTDSSVTLRCVDATKLFAAWTTFSLFDSEQLSGTAILDLLSVPSLWPSGLYDIDTGATLIAAINTTGSRLARINDICEAEQGIFFIGPNGYAIFHDRHHRLTETLSNTSQGTFGDSGAELPYDSLEPSYDDTYLYNDISVTPDGGSAQTASDLTSRDLYSPRTLTKSGLPIGGGVSAANNEAASMAAWLLANYKDPHLRFTRLTIDPQAADATLWPQVLGREISDRITVKRRPPGGGNVIAQDCFIESVAHEAVAGPLTSWKTTWTLSPVDTLTYWVLDSTTLSVLNSTTRLGY